MRWLLLAAGAVFSAAACPVAATSLSTSVWDAPDPVDPAAVRMPNIAFAPSGSDAQDYDKYFIFHRTGTDFATAYADLDECDNYASGRPGGRSGSNTIASAVASQFGLVGGVVGGMIAGAIAEAQMAAARRKLRRGTMRTCMGYKGYGAFGLPKDLWKEFNFEEGSRQFPEAERMNHLRMQAKVASGPRPTIGEIR